MRASIDPRCVTFPTIRCWVFSIESELIDQRSVVVRCLVVDCNDLHEETGEDFYWASAVEVVEYQVDEARFVFEGVVVRFWYFLQIIY
jgi:hypothetical protein